MGLAEEGQLKVAEVTDRTVLCGGCGLGWCGHTLGQDSPITCGWSDIIQSLVPNRLVLDPWRSPAGQLLPGPGACTVPISFGCFLSLTPGEFQVVEVDTGPNPLGAGRPSAPLEQPVWGGRATVLPCHTECSGAGCLLPSSPVGTCLLSPSLSLGFQGQVTLLSSPCTPSVSQQGKLWSLPSGKADALCPLFQFLEFTVCVPRRAVFASLSLTPQLLGSSGHRACACLVSAGPTAPSANRAVYVFLHTVANFGSSPPSSSLSWPSYPATESDLTPVPRARHGPAPGPGVRHPRRAALETATSTTPPPQTEPTARDTVA